jgi:hypothetical protein
MRAKTVRIDPPKAIEVESETTEAELATTEEEQGTTEVELAITEEEQGTTEVELAITEEERGTTAGELAAAVQVTAVETVEAEAGIASATQAPRVPGDLAG